MSAWLSMESLHEKFPATCATLCGILHDNTTQLQWHQTSHPKKYHWSKITLTWLVPLANSIQQIMANLQELLCYAYIFQLVSTHFQNIYNFVWHPHYCTKKNHSLSFSQVCNWSIFLFWINHTGYIVIILIPISMPKNYLKFRISNNFIDTSALRY
jgi:hypothetical protein